ncbi:hypothetical protein MSAN_02455800 [Mycena sanguinolenta]|uniref:Uncharacterized protein n=1 Tax=Mycena sanguinolenta TaxID=230812 RepID=A0A8H6WY40_9AGAR|nr:hypothetical protein MSAN_02455800 [Mycena sanguinolenta]
MPRRPAAGHDARSRSCTSFSYPCLAPPRALVVSSLPHSAFIVSFATHRYLHRRAQYVRLPPPSSSAPSSAPPAPASSTPNASATASEEEDARLRMRLETDAPSMVPAPIYTSPLFTALVAKAKEQQGGKGGGGVKLSLCHSGAEFVAGLLSPARRMKQRRS